MKRILCFLLFCFLVGCSSSNLPTEKYAQFRFYRNYTVENNELKVEIGNPLHSPLRVWVYNADEALQARFDKLNPVVLPAKTDTVLAFTGISELANEVRFGWAFGDPGTALKKEPLDLPFPTGRSYRVIQGNHGKFSHYTDYSRYAVDFALKVNDTICAATDGYVVGVIEQYEFGGKGDEWRPFSNYITMYDPNSGLYTQYVHLVKAGSFVEVGDPVKKGQPIGLSGLTGKTDIEHLHFNVLEPSAKGLKSTPFEFAGGVQSESLKRNDVIKK